MSVRWGRALAFGCIAAVFFTLGALTWAHWPDLEIDCGRELYVPARLSGLLPGGRALLYRDVQFQFGPLTAYLHALLFHFFGAKLSVLYCAGLAVAFGIALLTYLIAEYLIGVVGACLCSCLLTASLIYRPTLMNYVYPYTFAANYGLLLLGVVLWLCVRRAHAAAKTRADLWIIGAALGLSVLNKHEYALAAFVSVAATMLFVPGSRSERSWRSVLVPIAFPTLLLPAVIYGYFVAHIGLHQLVEENIFATHILRQQHYFYRRLTVPTQLRQVWYPYWQLSRWYLPALAWMVIAASIIARISSRWRARISPGVVTFALIAFPAWSLFWLAFSNSDGWQLLDWYSYALDGALVVYLLVIRRRRLWTTREATVWIVIAAGLVLALRTLNLSLLWYYPNLMIWPSAIVFVWLLFDAIPRALVPVQFHRAAWLAELALLAAVAGLYARHDLRARALTDFAVRGAPGVIYTDARRGIVFNRVANYLERQPHATLLAIPEESFLYDYVGRVSPLPYTHLVPGHVSDAGHERAAIDRLARTPPPEIVIFERDFHEYFPLRKGASARYFGADFNVALYRWIQDRYRRDRRFAVGGHWADIYIAK